MTARICPYCNEKMQRGYISAQNRLCWTPEGETDRGSTLWSKSPNSIVLAEYYLLAAAKVDADYCESCGKIIIDISG